jgi:hypothetical protein
MYRRKIKPVVGKVDTSKQIRVGYVSNELKPDDTAERQYILLKPLVQLDPTLTFHRVKVDEGVDTEQFLYSAWFRTLHDHVIKKVDVKFNGTKTGRICDRPKTRATVHEIPYPNFFRALSGPRQRDYRTTFFECKKCNKRMLQSRFDSSFSCDCKSVDRKFILENPAFYYRASTSKCTDCDKIIKRCLMTAESVCGCTLKLINRDDLHRVFKIQMFSTDTPLERGEAVILKEDNKTVRPYDIKKPTMKALIGEDEEEEEYIPQKKRMKKESVKETKVEWSEMQQDQGLPLEKFQEAEIQKAVQQMLR